MNTWEQRPGAWLRDGKLLAHGYSGHGEGKNNPACQAVPCVGPIPQGRYHILGPPFDSTTHGPYVLRLDPAPGNDMLGRAGFLVHGDSLKDPGGASLGCIVLPHTVRELIWLSGDRELEVIEGGA
jgi:hypothetical protein